MKTSKCHLLRGFQYRLSLLKYAVCGWNLQRAISRPPLKKFRLQIVISILNDGIQTCTLMFNWVYSNMCKIEHIHLWTSNDVWRVKDVALFMVYVSYFQTSFCFGQSGKHKIWIHTLYHRIIALWRFQPQTAYLVTICSENFLRGGTWMFSWLIVHHSSILLPSTITSHVLRLSLCGWLWKQIFIISKRL